jgi:hypothetical protein
MGGTLTLMWNQRVRTQYIPSGIGTVCSWRVCICTLLGPEGPEHSWSSGRRMNCSSGPFPVSIIRWQVRYRPYFENYTVDASILNLTAFGLQITKTNANIVPSGM